jgi:hypothetical protein
MPKLRDAEYQEGRDMGLGLKQTELRPCTAEFFVDWLIEYKGLDASQKDNVVSNLKRDYERVRLQGALDYASTLKPVTLNFSLLHLFGRRRG